MTPAAAGRRFLTTLPYTRRAAWTARAEIVDPGSLSKLRVVDRVVRASARHEAVVLNGSVRPDQAAATAIARRRRPSAVVLADATWKAGSGAAGRLRRAAVRALDHDDAHFCVLSEAEAALFPANWGVARERVHVTPFHWVLDEREVETVPEPGSGVFAGGDSLRDYGPLLAAADGLRAEVTVASRWPRPERLARNVRLGPLPSSSYDEALRQAAVVVVALEPRADRSAGQQTYLNAMVLGKPVVVTDALGVREYVDDRETGLIVPPADPAALREALDWLLDPGNADEARALGERARAAALERFGPEEYVRRLLGVVDAALERRAAARE